MPSSTASFSPVSRFFSHVSVLMGPDHTTTKQGGGLLGNPRSSLQGMLLSQTLLRSGGYVCSGNGSMPVFSQFQLYCLLLYKQISALQFLLRIPNSSASHLTPCLVPAHLLPWETELCCFFSQLRAEIFLQTKPQCDLTFDLKFPHKGPDHAYCGTPWNADRGRG